MGMNREIKKVIKSRPTMEGAGVRLNRAFGFGGENVFDPFLLLDDFRGDRPEDYMAGFPWHPHRGIETITYMLQGSVEHGDSLENRGVISPGDVQWMTAGSGIIHQEMPKGDVESHMGGFQLWANLPASQKMMDPRYREVKDAEIPRVTLAGGTVVRVISGEVAGIRGPVQDIVIEPEYLDVTVPAGTAFTHPTRPGFTVFAYCIEGHARFASEKDPLVGNKELVLFEDGERICAFCEEESARFLLISGRPLREPVAWYGPIVMNTQAELQTAFEEYRDGNFIKYKKA